MFMTAPLSVKNSVCQIVLESKVSYMLSFFNGQAIHFLARIYSELVNVTDIWMI